MGQSLKKFGALLLLSLTLHACTYMNTDAYIHSLKKGFLHLTPLSCYFAGIELKKDKEIGLIIEQCHDEFFVNTEDWSTADFYHAVCQTVEEINKTIGSTQFQVPKTSTLKQAYQVSAFGLELLSYLKHHHQGIGKSLTKEEFQKILQVVILDSGVTNVVAKEMLLYVYGVPATALLIKQCLVPKLIPNEVFIPAVTSATVFLLAKLNKI